MKLELRSYHLSPIQTDDAIALHNFLSKNAVRLKKFFPKTLEQNQTLDLSKRFVQKKSQEFQNKEEFLFSLKEKDSETLLGLVYLKELDRIKKQGEFAYCIDQSIAKLGLTTEAIKLLSAYAFNNLGLKCLQIIVHESNMPSIKVAKNCNFKWKKTLEKNFMPPGESALDMELYELHKN